MLITFDRGREYKLPSVASYSAAFLEFRHLYPWVTQFVTWDEANFFGEPTSTHVGRVVGYYRALRTDCPTCTILAPDLLDLPRYAVSPVRYAHEFIRELGSQPQYWALNDYVGANRMSTASTKQLLAAVSGKVWIAEVAGIISNGTHAAVASTERVEHAAQVDRFILSDIASLSPRIQRIYLYEWRAASGRNLWDSALISAAGQPRPGLRRPRGHARRMGDQARLCDLDGAAVLRADGPSLTRRAGRSARLPRMLRPRRTLLLALCGLAALPGVASAHPVVGVADNSSQMFGDPRFLALGITDVRDDVPWNVLSRRSARRSLATWLAAAQAAGMTPLITFDHDNGSVATQRHLPTVKQFSNAFRQFRALYPWVTEFETWDEANFYLEGTSTNPKRAAQFYEVLRKDCLELHDPRRRTCSTCRPARATRSTSWARTFVNLVHGQPPIWGINNYVGANRLETRHHGRCSDAVRGKIWFTETGGIVDRHNASKVGFPQNPNHAAKVDRFILTKLAEPQPPDQADLSLRLERLARLQLGLGADLLERSAAARL